MKQFTYTITDPLGLHARPAGQLVKVAAAFKCDIKLKTPAKEVDGKRIMAVMGLGVTGGSVITVLCTGEDEAEASAAIQKFLSETL